MAQKKKTTPEKKSAKKKLSPKKTKAPKKAVVKKSAAKKKKTKKEDLMCFLTTACVSYYHLQDDGYELNTLRNYRDTYLLRSPEGRTLVNTYYRVAPPIVNRIAQDPSAKQVYAYIYSEIKQACTEIEKQAYQKAKQIYMALVNTLREKYAL